MKNDAKIGNGIWEMESRALMLFEEGLPEPYR